MRRISHAVYHVKPVHTTSTSSSFIIHHQFLFSNSSIICSAILSSWFKPPATSLPLTTLSVGSSSDGSSFFLPRGTVKTQFESDRGPARFCHTPIWEFSVSRRRQVRDGEGALQHFLSFALRVDDSSLGILSTAAGKFVLALRPLINMAASS